MIVFFQNGRADEIPERVERKLESENKYTVCKGNHGMSPEQTLQRECLPAKRSGFLNLGTATTKTRPLPLTQSIGDDRTKISISRFDISASGTGLT